MDKEDLKDQIIRAFENTPYPGEALTGTDEDEGVSAFFEGKSWKGNDVNDLRQHYVALALFQPEAFRYFLPAFMLAELEDPNAADIIGASIVFVFAEPDPNWEHSYEMRLGQFSPEEKSAILGFLDYMRSTYGVFSDQISYATSRLQP